MTGQDNRHPHQDQPVLRRGTEPERAQGALIMIHGRGASAEDMLDLAGELDVQGLSLIAPQAEGRVWYPESFLAPREANGAHIDGAFMLLDRLIAELGEHGLARESIALVGFSQGACLAADYAFNRSGAGSPLGGVIALSGGLIGPSGTEFTPGADLAGMPVFLGCSDTDPFIPAERVRESHEAFRRAGATTTMQLYPGMPHTVNADEIAHANRLIARLREAPAG
jgi:predicted esterase